MAKYGRADLPGHDGRAARRARDSAHGEPEHRQFDTAFCVSIEAKQGTSTGISAADRPATVLAAIDRRPGRGPGAARPHVSVRARPAASWCGRGRPRPRDLAGSRACIGRRHLRGHEHGRHHGRVPQLTTFARRHGLLLVTIADLIKYRMQHERFVRRVASADLRPSSGRSRCTPSRACWTARRTWRSSKARLATG